MKAVLLFLYSFIAIFMICAVDATSQNKNSPANLTREDYMEIMFSYRRDFNKMVIIAKENQENSFTNIEKLLSTIQVTLEEHFMKNLLGFKEDLQKTKNDILEEVKDMVKDNKIEFNKKLSSTDDEISNVSKKLSLTSDKLINVNDKLDLTNFELRNVKHNLNSTSATLSTVEEKLNSTSDKLTTVEEKLNTTSDTLITVEDKLNSTSDTLSTVEEKLNSTSDTLTTVEEKLKTTSDTLTIVEEKLNSTSDTLTTVEEMLNSTSDKLGNELRSTNSKQVNITEQLRNLSGELTEVNREVFKLHKSINTISDWNGRTIVPSNHTEKGVIITPYYPEVYINNFDGIIKIQALSNYYTRLSFESFDTEGTHDYLEINSTSTNRLHKFSGSTMPNAVTSSSTLLLRFRTDVNTLRKGFKLTYSFYQ